MPNEHHLTRKLRAYFGKLERSGAPFSATKIAGGSKFQRSGLADWWLCVNGRFVLLETKSLTGVLTLKQERELIRQSRAGAVILVSTDFDEIRAWIERLLSDA